MGSSSSKPSKSKPPKTKPQNPPRKIRKSPHPPISRPLNYPSLNYPSLAPLPLPPLNQRPRHNPEQVAGDRYRTLLHDNPTFAGTQKPKPSHHPPPPKPVPARKPQPAKPPPKQKAPYQFRPLDEIGRAPKGKYPPRSSSKQAPPLPHPSKQGQGKPQPRFGGIRKDGNGVWCVKVLADGRWYRCVDVGVQPPGF